MAPIGVGIVGGGIFVKEQHLPAVQACEHLALKAIYSRSLKSAQETAALISSTSSSGVSSPDLYAEDAGDGKGYADLLARDDISALILALPILAQPAFIEKALAAGKHVLAEKPIGPDVATARKLVDLHTKLKREQGTASLAIAENFRFVPKFAYASGEARKLGKITGFNVRVWSLVQTGNKYIETSWRKTPQHQGGFLLDGGVHMTASLRFLLGPDNAPETLAAFSSLTQEHLPPIDSADAIIKTKSGAVGSFSVRYGSIVKTSTLQVVGEKGSVTIDNDKVTVAWLGGETTEKDFEFDTAVATEVRAWAESILDGKPNPLQDPEEALADLELMEKIFRSGEQNGAVQTFEYQ